VQAPDILMGPKIRGSVRLVEMMDIRVQNIPVEDCEEPLIDIATSGLIAYGPPPECPETAPFYRMLREGVVYKLEKAQQRLPKGLQLRLYEGFRSPNVQKVLFAGQLQRVRQENPFQDDAWCYMQAAKLASPLNTFEGDDIIPPHSTGGAIDIEIVDETGNPLDFGMKLSDWGVVPPELCATAFDGLSNIVKGNRELLAEALTAEGFVNYPREWWHFSYGDQYWAHATGSTKALYGTVYGNVLQNLT